MDVPDWAPALASMLGIGVGIDYALLIITRYRAALAAGLRAARGGRRVGHHGRALGADRRHDRRDLAARPAADGPPLPLRRRGRDDHRRAGRDGGVGHARARADGDGRGADRPLRIPGTNRPRRATRPARRPRAGAARCSGARWSPRSRACRAARARLPVRRAAARLPRPRQRRGRHDDAPGLRPRVPGLRPRRERPAAARRVDPEPGRARRDGRAGRRAARRARRRRRHRAGHQPGRRRGDAHRDPDARRRRTRRPRTSSTTCATTCSPAPAPR